jgi:hypothetical protein
MKSSLFISYDTSLADSCTKMKDRFVQWKVKDPFPFTAADLDELIPPQLEEFMNLLLTEKPAIEIEKLKALQNLYDFNAKKNSEIRFRYDSITIRD